MLATSRKESATSPENLARRIGKLPTSDDDQMLLALGLDAANIEVVDIKAANKDAVETKTMDDNAVRTEIIVSEVTRTERWSKHRIDRPSSTEDVQRKVSKNRKSKSKEKDPSEPFVPHGREKHFHPDLHATGKCHGLLFLKPFV